MTVSHTPIVRLLTCREAATQLNVSTDTVRRMVRLGRLDSVQLGKRCLRVSEDSVVSLSKNGGAK